MLILVIEVVQSGLLGFFVFWLGTSDLEVVLMKRLMECVCGTA